MPQANRVGKSDSGYKGRAKVLSRVLPEKEAELLSNVKKILDLFKTQGLLTYRRIHVMPILRSNGFFSVNKDMAGLEDLQVYLCNGKTLFLELKTISGKLSEHQIRRQKELLSMHHDYVVIRNIDALISCLREHGLSIWAYPG